MVNYKKYAPYIFYISVLFALSNTNIGYAQVKTDAQFDNEIKQEMESFIEDKINTSFPNIDTLETLNGDQFYFNKINEPTIIFIGDDGCAPCRFILPLFIKVANKIKYKHYNFVYLTYDDSTTIYDELKQQKANDLKVLKIIITSRDMINDEKLAICYPTMYYINSDKTIKYITLGGATENAGKILDEWDEKLNSLK